MWAISTIISDPVSRATFADSFEVDRARIGAGADDDQLRFALTRQPLQFFIVDGFSILAHAVWHDVVVLAGEVQRMAVREMSAVGKVHPHDGVSRFQHREVDRHVGLASGVRLDVDMFGAEQLFRALDGETFDDVHELAAAVVTPSGIAFGILVREDRTVASRTALEVKFSDAIISRPVDCRRFSFSMAS